MSELTPERMKEILLSVAEGLRMAAEERVIGSLTLDLDEKLVPIEDAPPYALGFKNEGFCYTIDVTYLTPTEAAK